MIDRASALAGFLLTETGSVLGVWVGRVAKLASAPKSNPLDRKGLRQVGKTAKKKAKLAARA